MFSRLRFYYLFPVMHPLYKTLKYKLTFLRHVINCLTPFSRFQNPVSRNRFRFCRETFSRLRFYYSLPGMHPLYKTIKYKHTFLRHSAMLSIVGGNGSHRQCHYVSAHSKRQPVGPTKRTASSSVRSDLAEV